MTARNLIVDGRRFELEDDVSVDAIDIVMSNALRQGTASIRTKGGEMAEFDLSPDSRYEIESGR